MRMTTTELLLLAPAFFCSVLLIVVVKAPFYALSTPIWYKAVRGSGCIQMDLNFFSDYLAKSDMDEDDVNKLLSGELSPTHPLSKAAQSDDFHPVVDPWGSPYACVKVDHGPKKPLRWHVYSLGQDMVSSTRGNDDDDISTWSRDTCGSFYVREFRFRARLRLLVQTLCLMPFVYVGLVATKRWMTRDLPAWRNARQSRKKRLRSWQKDELGVVSSRSNGGGKQR